MNFVSEIETGEYTQDYESLANYYRVDTGNLNKISNKKTDSQLSKLETELFFVEFLDVEGIHIYRRDGKYVGRFDDTKPHPRDIIKQVSSSK
ncbi:MAG: hypothetical protein KDI90_06530 [Alphaproteobacteria bacterium]|nr:hypothetical protein [Alphaproteobacteria bacterium]MCB9974970.1 hypothetical protein [Rhodospirillales bacterium]